MKRTLNGEPAAAAAGAAASAAPSSSSSKSPSPAREPFRTSPASDGLQRGAQQLVLQHVFAGQQYDSQRYVGGRSELPGPLAITLNRRTLKLVQAAEYVVCEKSDGERAMLLMVPKPTGSVPTGAYLINRSFEVSVLEQGAQYAALCACGGLTLLDGELIQRRTDEQTGTGACALYMVFDVITANGGAVGGKPFSERMDVIGKAVRAPFRAADDRLLAGGKPGLPLYILGKFFLPKAEIGRLFESIFEERGSGGAYSSSSSFSAAVALTAPLESQMDGSGGHGEHGGIRRVYRHGIRVNGTDGIVFTPVRATYLDQFGSASAACAAPLLKWKFADENTVDFRLKRDDLEEQGGETQQQTQSQAQQRHVPLYLAGGKDKRSGVELDLPVGRTLLSPQECDAYLALLDRLACDSVVVEAGYDGAASTWRIRRVRDRKTRANFILTGWSTLEVMAENISPAELVGVLGIGSAGGGVQR